MRECGRQELRRTVLPCARDAHLFNTTIRENPLRARRDASEPELGASCSRIARLDEARP